MRVPSHVHQLLIGTTTTSHLYHCHNDRTHRRHPRLCDSRSQRAVRKSFLRHHRHELVLRRSRPIATAGESCSSYARNRVRLILHTKIYQHTCPQNSRTRFRIEITFIRSLAGQRTRPRSRHPTVCCFTTTRAIAVFLPPPMKKFLQVYLNTFRLFNGIMARS